MAAGLAVAAVGSDSLGSIRIPASYCGVYALKPTHGEISARGVVPAARRLDTVGLLARSVDDLTVLLQVLAGYDADDARSRRRRVALRLPDWEPGNLRAGLLPDLAAAWRTARGDRGIRDGAGEIAAMSWASAATVDFSDWDFARTRRAGLLLMEAEMLGTFADDLADTEHRGIGTLSAALLGYAAGKTAADYATADRVLDAATLKMRRLFAQIDVLVLADDAAGRVSAGWPGAGFASRPHQFRQPGRLPRGEHSDGLPAQRHADRPATGGRARLRLCACWNWRRCALRRWMSSRRTLPLSDR